jgi:ParB/RepB/Spo0J family partition protein
MRHDEHYVESLASSAGQPVGRIVAIDLLDPNPNQPRQVMGDLSELIASVAEKGIIEPLVVRQRGSRYQIIAGERRYHASVQAGLREVPVIIREVDDIEVMELALVENLQRKDLTAFEEAEALLQLCETCSYTHEDLAQKLGKSRVSITESLSLVRHARGRCGICAGSRTSTRSPRCCRSAAADPRRCWRWSRRWSIAARRRDATCARPRPKARRHGPSSSSSPSNPNEGVQPEAEFQEVARRQSEIIEALLEHHQRAPGLELTQPIPAGSVRARLGRGERRWSDWTEPEYPGFRGARASCLVYII